MHIKVKRKRAEYNIVSYNNDHTFTSLIDCDEDTNQDISINSELKMMVLVILACSLLGIGIGQTAISTLGIPYIDDNVASKDSPMYIAITIGVRILGPAGGFILGSFCTRIAVNLQETALSPSDPKYIGAWWLGKFYIYDVHTIYANLIHWNYCDRKSKIKFKKIITRMKYPDRFFFFF